MVNLEACPGEPGSPRTHFSWQNVIAEHEIRNISCAAQDPEDLCTFAYITKDLQTSHHYCHVFSTVDVVSVPVMVAGSGLERQQWPSNIQRSPFYSREWQPRWKHPVDPLFPAPQVAGGRTLWPQLSLPLLTQQEVSSIQLSGASSTQKLQEVLQP